MPEFHGYPCWYELTTPDPEGAAAFYGAVIGWEVTPVPMGEYTYRLASMAGVNTAGITPPMGGEMPTHWLIYFAVTDCDAMVADVGAAGGQVLMPAMDIPGTGRFAILTDPQGAAFGILQPLPDSDGAAYQPGKTGHGSWAELMTSDPVAGLGFYADAFGWAASSAMDMGAMGTYQLFGLDGKDLGGMMGLMAPGMPPFWGAYFTVDSIEAAITRLEAAGGKVINGPTEVPGGAWIVQGTDPQGAYFALTGPK